MLPVFDAATIREWDLYTIKHEPIDSVDLMERAAMNCIESILKYANHHKEVVVFCGNGNNGGDGLAIARILSNHGINIKVVVSKEGKRSTDNLENLERLRSLNKEVISELYDSDQFELEKGQLIIDAIFGTGINKAISGFWKGIIDKINRFKGFVISIDLPSGLPCSPSDFLPESFKDLSIIRATLTLTFEIPKLSLLLPEYGEFGGRLEVITIGLLNEFTKDKKTNYYYITDKDIRTKFKKRTKFSHKGTYGHAMIIAGETGKCGAAILAGKACIHSGAGLVTIVTKNSCHNSIHASTPELMVENRRSGMDYSKADVIALGPGMGVNDESSEVLLEVLERFKGSLILDADALTMISEKSETVLPVNSILTPHPKEFDRLAGVCKSAYHRLNTAQKLAMDKKVFIVLKGAHTSVCTPEGKVYFNSSGNPGMATAGSGDVLTGILAGFLSQAYTPENTCLLGVYVHGKAGDLAAEYLSETGMTSGDLIEYLNPVYKMLEQYY